MLGKILIIDDYADNREILRLMLEQAGYAVSEASNGRDGIDVALREQPDVALVVGRIDRKHARLDLVQAGRWIVVARSAVGVDEIVGVGCIVLPASSAH